MLINRLFIGTVSLLAVITAPAAAQLSSYNGKWHSVVSKSYWSDGKLPKEFSLTADLEFKDGKLIYQSINDTDKTKPALVGFTATLDDKPNPVADQSRVDAVRLKQMGPDVLQWLYMKGDDVIVGEYLTFSADGESYVRRGVGKSPDGHSKAFEEYFERVH